MRAIALVPALLLLGACKNEGEIVREEPQVSLEVFTPTYGEFMGDRAATVTGHVDPWWVPLRIEGELVRVQRDGTFTAEVPIDHAYRILDVEAEYNTQYQRVRVPVFRGQDPIDSWPGGMTMRLTPAGLAKIGEGLGAMIDASGWDQQIFDQLPSTSFSGITIAPVSVSHDPTVVELNPAEDGVDVLLSFRNLAINYEISGSWNNQPWSAPMSIGYGRIGVGLRGAPNVDDAGMLSLVLSDGEIALDDPDVVIAGLDGWLVELILDGVGALIEPLGEGMLDMVMSQFGTFDLGGPYVFETDLMGTAMEIRLSEVYGDLDGVAAGLGLGLDEPAIVGPLPIPTPTSDSPDVHAGLGLHEGILQLALSNGDLLSMLEQDITLPGMFGEIIGGQMERLPGGEQAPSGDGWCVALHPQPAQVVRLQSGLAPWIVLYLPDVEVDIGTVQLGGCQTWLKASLAFELGLDVRSGTVLTMNLLTPEGAVLEYGAERGTWEELEVIDGLSGFLGGLIDLMGANFTIDLADFFGDLGSTSNDPTLSALGDLQPRILDSQPLLNEDGTHQEGLYMISLGLWQ